MTEVQPQSAVDVGTTFRVGAMLGQTSRVIIGNFIPFGMISLIFAGVQALLYWGLLGLPIFGIDALGPSGTASGAAAVGAGWTILANVLIPLVLYAVVTAVMIYGTVTYLRGHSVALGPCITRGLRFAGSVILVSLAVGLLVGLGTLLFIIPGLFLLVIWWVAVPAAVAEDLGVGASMQRSAALTSGNRWRVFGIIIILGLVPILLNIPLQLLGQVLTFVPLLIVALVVNAFTMMLSAVAAGVGYFQLRVAKEGADIEQIAAVFD